MTSQIKFQGSLKGVAMIAAALVTSLVSLQAQAQVGPRVTSTGVRNPPRAVAPPAYKPPPAPFVNKNTCKRAGSSITLC